MTRAREISNVLGRNIESTTFTATAGQTAFSITHAAGRIQVYMNGLLLDPTVDWTSDGSTVTLTEGAVAGDELEVVKFDALSVANVVPATGGTFNGNVTVDGKIYTEGNNISLGSLGGTNDLEIVGADGTNGWSGNAGVYSQTSSEFRFHAGTGEMDIYVDGFGWFAEGVKGAFMPYDATQKFTLTGSGSTYTWSPANLPANVWVSISCHISSTDPDQSDHLDVIVGPSSYTNTTWGDTYAAYVPPHTHSVMTNLGDSQDVYAGHYGAWHHIVAKTSSSGGLVFTIGGTNAGSGVSARIQGYWQQT